MPSLQALEDLDVSGNRLAALPDSIGQLRRLRFLNALRNQLTALPDAIGGCTALVRLGLGTGSMPVHSAGAFGRSRGLTAAWPCAAPATRPLPQVRLGLKSNRLASLPPGVGKLAALKELYLTGGWVEDQGRSRAGVWGAAGLGGAGWRLGDDAVFHSSG